MEVQGADCTEPGRYFLDDPEVVRRVAGTLNLPAYTEEDKGGILAAALHRYYSRLRNMELMEVEALEVVCTGSDSDLLGIVDAIPSHRQRMVA